MLLSLNTAASSPYCMWLACRFPVLMAALIPFVRLYAIIMDAIRYKRSAALYNESYSYSLLGVRHSVLLQESIATISGWLHHHFLCSYIR